MALNAQRLEGHWQEIKGKLRNRWGQLTDDELQQARGDVEQLIGTIQRRTGEARDSIRSFIEELGETPTMKQAADTIRGYAETAAESMQGVAQQASEGLRTGMREGRHMIQQHPLESVLTCFGIGLATGVALGILLRGR